MSYQDSGNEGLLISSSKIHMSSKLPFLIHVVSVVPLTSSECQPKV